MSVVFSLDELAVLVRERGVPAYVEMTGGGVATLYAGELDADGYPLVAAGPGWFDGPNFSDSRAVFGDFYVGLGGEGEADHFVSVENPVPLSALADVVMDWVRRAESLVRCRDCGWCSSDPFTADVVNEQAEVCPECQSLSLVFRVDGESFPVGEGES